MGSKGSTDSRAPVRACCVWGSTATMPLKPKPPWASKCGRSIWSHGRVKAAKIGRDDEQGHHQQVAYRLPALDFLALGASRKQIQSELFREMGLLSVGTCAAGAVLGMPLAWVIWQCFRMSVVNTREMRLTFDPQAYLLTLLFSVFVILMIFAGRRKNCTRPAAHTVPGCAGAERRKLG